MVKEIPGILAEIVAQKRIELARADIVETGLDECSAALIAGRRDFEAALRTHEPAIIAEIKKASPSRGVLAEHFDPAGTALAYEKGGAAALSVLTDERFFQGSLRHLLDARVAVALPVLRKDFTIERYHVLEAASHGADAILLIAAILSERDLRDLREFAASFHMTALVEVHDEEELERAVASGASVIGVNNRDLRTFEVNLEVSFRLAPHMPNGTLMVAESGIRTSEDVRALRAAGYRGFLVGEHLMTAADPAAALRALLA